MDDAVGSDGDGAGPEARDGDQPPADPVEFEHAVGVGDVDEPARGLGDRPRLAVSPVVLRVEPGRVRRRAAFGLDADGAELRGDNGRPLDHARSVDGRTRVGAQHGDEGGGHERAGDDGARDKGASGKHGDSIGSAAVSCSQPSGCEGARTAVEGQK